MYILRINHFLSTETCLFGGIGIDIVNLPFFTIFTGFSVLFESFGFINTECDLDLTILDSERSNVGKFKELFEESFFVPSDSLFGVWLS